jgi:malate dehydrogenase (oxaloacetate-decarboxylating)
MDEPQTFPAVAKAVAMQAIEDGVARVQMTGDEVYAQAKKEIDESRELTQSLMDNNLIKEPTIEMIETCLEKAIKLVG